MAGQKLKSARAIAAKVLNQCDPRRNYAGPILDGLLHKTDQRQRATDLVFGTLRNRGALDAVIAAFSGRPVQRIQPELLNIIRIGTYELVYLPATGEHAVVNEAVGNAKAAAGEKQAGFVNAVLRQILRHISNRRIPLAQAHIRRTLLHPSTPLRACPEEFEGVKSLHAERRRGTTGCEFDTDFLPDSEASLAGYLSVAFSLPEWLVNGWLDKFGKESTRQICFASNRRPGIYLRPNTLKTKMDALAERFRQAGIDFDTDPNNSMIRIRNPQAIPQIPGFKEGEFTVQDLTASQPVRLLNPQPGWTILDLCAAPGTKTMQLAEATDDAAKIIATDIDARRLEMVRENVARLGIKSVDVVSYEQVPGIADCGLPNADVQIENRKSKVENSFDCVLLDVPCSNTGVLARRIEARYRINPAKMQGLTRIQAGLLDRAMEIVKPNGKICYSTCSIQKAENSELIDNFLKKNKNFALESEQLTLPSAEGFDHDGGYTAILVKIKTLS
jgi:16S rRNA (cytosine967-C5)-methyltransferase